MSIKRFFLHSYFHICIHLPILILSLNCYIILIKGLPHHYPETTPAFISYFLKGEQFSGPKHYENEIKLYTNNS